MRFFWLCMTLAPPLWAAVHRRGASKHFAGLGIFCLKPQGLVVSAALKRLNLHIKPRFAGSRAPPGRGPLCSFGIWYIVHIVWQMFFLSFVKSLVYVVRFFLLRRVYIATQVSQQHDLHRVRRSCILDGSKMWKPERICDISRLRSPQRLLKLYMICLYESPPLM